MTLYRFKMGKQDNNEKRFFTNLELSQMFEHEVMPIYGIIAFFN